MRESTGDPLLVKYAIGNAILAAIPTVLHAREAIAEYNHVVHLVDLLVMPSIFGLLALLLQPYFLFQLFCKCSSGLRWLFLIILVLAAFCFVLNILLFAIILFWANFPGPG